MKKRFLTHMLLLASLVLLIILTACAPRASTVAEPPAEEAMAEDSGAVAADQAQRVVEEPAAEEPAEEEAAEEFMGEVMVEEEAVAEAPAPEGVGAVAPAPTAVAAQEQGAEVVPADQPADMFFEDYGTNPFVTASIDNLSTFAVDVDTGSYTLTRSYLNDYILPPPEAIRLEEFVNYFDQDYSLPQDNAFNIVMDAAPTPFGGQGAYVMRVGIQGYDVPDDQRPDATLIFVVDISGSMDQDNRLGAVKESLYTLIDELRPTDQIGIVVYGSRGKVLLEPTPVSRPTKIVRAIEKLNPGGSTNAEEGLNLAYQMMTANYDAGRINRIILCSDGVANVGASGPEAILATVQQQAREGITLTTIGFGMGNYNDVLMEQLANDGDGQYFYVDTQAESERVFVEDLTGTLLTIAKDAKVQVAFNPDAVLAYRLMGYENRDVADEDFRNDAVDAGEIGSGHSVTALYEIIPTEQAPTQAPIATVYLRWEDPDTGEVTEIEKSLFTNDIADSFDDASPRFRLDVAVAAFADVLGEGAWSQSTDLDEVSRVAEDAANDLQDPDAQELLGLILLAMELGA
jgi:Ca-activated chloride channel family protein